MFEFLNQCCLSVVSSVLMRKQARTRKNGRVGEQSGAQVSHMRQHAFYQMRSKRIGILDGRLSIGDIILTVPKTAIVDYDCFGMGVLEDCLAIRQN